MPQGTGHLPGKVALTADSVSNPNWGQVVVTTPLLEGGDPGMRLVVCVSGRGWAVVVTWVRPGSQKPVWGVKMGAVSHAIAASKRGCMGSREA